MSAWKQKPDKPASRKIQPTEQAVHRKGCPQKRLSIIATKGMDVFLFIALRLMQKTDRVTMRLDENLSSLRDFQTATASMARKRHFAAYARGAFLFLFST